MALAAHSQPHQGSCRQALLLGLDASLSVDPHEFTVQRVGLANALRNPEVADAFVGNASSHIVFAVYDWSGTYDQNVIIDWTIIDSYETLWAVAANIETAGQMSRVGKTALGSSLLFAQKMLEQQAHCPTRTLDLSGDGENNDGIAPEFVRDRLAANGITVNGLVIEQGGDTAGREDASAARLTRYYHRNVIAGPLAFTETIYGFDDYGAAMKRKLLLELVPAFAMALPR